MGKVNPPRITWMVSIPAVCRPSRSDSAAYSILFFKMYFLHVNPFPPQTFEAQNDGKRNRERKHLQKRAERFAHFSIFSSKSCCLSNSGWLWPRLWVFGSVLKPACGLPCLRARECVCGPAQNKSGHSSPEVGVCRRERHPFIFLHASRDPGGDHMPEPGQESLLCD